MGCDLYPDIVHKENVTADDFGGDHIDHLCDRIQKACKGFGTNETYVLYSCVVLARLFGLGRIFRPGIDE